MLPDAIFIEVVEPSAWSISEKFEFRGTFHVPGSSPAPGSSNPRLGVNTLVMMEP
jgi:hypothetical protein